MMNGNYLAISKALSIFRSVHNGLSYLINILLFLALQEKGMQS